MSSKVKKRTSIIEYSFANYVRMAFAVQILSATFVRVTVESGTRRTTKQQWWRPKHHRHRANTIFHSKLLCSNFYFFIIIFRCTVRKFVSSQQAATENKKIVRGAHLRFKCNCAYDFSAGHLRFVRLLNANTQRPERFIANVALGSSVKN